MHQDTVVLKENFCQIYELASLSTCLASRGRWARISTDIRTTTVVQAWSVCMNLVCTDGNCGSSIPPFHRRGFQSLELSVTKRLKNLTVSYTKTRRKKYISCGTASEIAAVLSSSGASGDVELLENLVRGQYILWFQIDYAFADKSYGVFLPLLS